jgi:hypothetical protein
LGVGRRWASKSGAALVNPLGDIPRLFRSLEISDDVFGVKQVDHAGYIDCAEEMPTKLARGSESRASIVVDPHCRMIGSKIWSGLAKGSGAVTRLKT